MKHDVPARRPRPHLPVPLRARAAAYEEDPDRKPRATRKTPAGVPRQRRGPRSRNNPSARQERGFEQAAGAGPLARGVASLRHDKRGITASAQAMRAERSAVRRLRRRRGRVDRKPAHVEALHADRRRRAQRGSPDRILRRPGGADGYVSLGARDGRRRHAAAAASRKGPNAGRRIHRPGERDPRRALKPDGPSRTWTTRSRSPSGRPVQPLP